MKIVKYLVARFIFNIFSISIWLEILEFIPRACIRSRLLVRKQEHSNKRERAILCSVQFLPHIFHIINHKNRKKNREKQSHSNYFYHIIDYSLHFIATIGYAPRGLLGTYWEGRGTTLPLNFSFKKRKKYFFVRVRGYFYLEVLRPKYL